MVIRFSCFLHIVLIFAFLTAGISPACAFISGGNGQFIEICAADGLLKRIKVSDDYQPLGEESQRPLPSHSYKKTDCSFCFTNAHMDKNLSYHKGQIFEFFSSEEASDLDIYGFSDVFSHYFNPRAPPQTFS